MTLSILGKGAEYIKKNMHVFLSILPFLFPKEKKFLIRYSLVVILIVVAILLDVAIPISTKYIVQVLSVAHVSNIRQTLSFEVILIFLSFGMIWIFAKVISQFRQITMYRVFERAIRLLGVSLFVHLSKLSMRYHDDRKTGAVLNAIDRAQTAIPNVFWGILFVIIPTVTEIIIASGILWSLYGALYGITLFSVMVAFILVTILGTRRAIRYQRAGNKYSQLAASYMVERLTNMATLKMTLMNESDEVNRCDRILEDRENAMTKQLVNMDFVGIWQVLVIGAGLIFLTFHTAKVVLLNGGLHVSDYVLIVGYLIQFATPMGTFGLIFRQIKQGMIDLENVVEILDETIEVSDDKNAKKLEVSTGEIVFDNVFFQYGEHKIYNGLSFKVPSAQKIAIVGPSGSGKSTIVKLLLRFYDVDGGVICIDNQDIRSLTQSSLRSVIGVVPQDCVLFNESIYFNITYANPNVSPDFVNEVIHLVHLDTTIARMPNGLKTMVGEKGVKLSGGERQRIAIARALLKKPKIFIFDEATSSLDAQTESEIIKNLEELSKNVTTIVIAHRLSTIVKSDEILVLNHHGQIVERGNHHYLLDLKGLYFEMWENQRKSQDIKGKIGSAFHD